MLIDRIYSKVKTFVNTDVRGNVSPAEFNLFLHDAIQSRLEELFYDFRRETVRDNRSLQAFNLANLPDRLIEKIMHYHTSLAVLVDSTGNITLPSDFKYLDNISSATVELFEHVDTSKEFRIIKGCASTQYPICLTSGNTINIYPQLAENTSITVEYLREVFIPKWTYTEISGAEIFNPSATDFQDADIHASEEDEIVRRVLLRFGVNLKEEEIQAFSMQNDSKEFNQNNAI